MATTKDKRQALQEVFKRRKRHVLLLELHRDGYCCCKDKLPMFGTTEQNIQNQQSKIITIFGVDDFTQAVEAAIHYGIIERKPKPPLVFSNKWSESLQHEHRSYINTLSKKEKIEIGAEEE